MSVTFINNIDDNTKYEKIEQYCEKIWKKSPETSIKLFFFILDNKCGKNQPIAFKKIMFWLYNNYIDVFYKNYSLIIGKYNSKTMPPSQAKSMLSKDYEKHQKILDEFVSPDYQRSFELFWESSANDSLFKAYNLPKYGNWKDLIDICMYIKRKNELTDENFKKVNYTT